MIRHTRYQAVGFTRIALISAVALLAQATSASPASAGESDFAIHFASAKAGTVTAMTLHIVYRKPSDPGGKPSPIRHAVITLPRDTELRVHGVPRCDATNQDLQTMGPSACPEASRVGDGTLTAVTGFGPPVDPYPTRVTIFNDGRGWIEVVQDSQSGATLAVDRFELKGGKLIGNPPSTPGGPPDGETAVRTIDFAFPKSRAFVVTPPSCPATHVWASSATFSFADGTTQHVSSTTGCHGSPRAPGMTVHASPRTVEVGRRWIHFQVESPIEACTRGATVHFMGRTAHTGRRGRATMRVRLRKPGAYRASVKKPGCRSASTTVSATPDPAD